MRKLLRAAAVARGRQLPGSRWARRPALLGFPGLGAQRSGRAAEQGGRPTALAVSLQPLGRLRPSVYRGVGLKLNIQKTKIMASGPITLWQIDGETVADFILGGSKITADGDCSHEIKRRLLLGRKVMRT